MVNNGLNRIKKKDPIKSSIMRVPPPLVGAVYAYGRIKSGKTTSLLAFAGMYHDNPNRNYKVFDLWGGDRNEHLYWTLPSNQSRYWQYVKKVLRLSDEGPKQYKVNLLYPITSKLPNKLPNNDFVKSKIFTIPIDNIELEDISLVIGPPSESSSGAWKETTYKLPKKINVPEFISKYKKNAGDKNLLYLNFLYPLSREGLLQEKDCIYNINSSFIKKEVDDQETITVLCLDFVDKEYRFFILGYFLRMINAELDRRRRHCIGVIREASEFFKVNDQSVVHPRYKILKSMLSQWIRMGRRGFHLLLDTQSPNETRGLVDGQQDLTLLGRLPGQADRLLATDQLKRDGFITTKQVGKLGANEPGQFLVCPSGKHSFFSYFLLPKCSYWEESNGNFYNNVWANRVGDKWVGYKEEIKTLQTKFKEEEKIVKENEKPKKNRFKNKEDLEDIEIVTIRPNEKQFEDETKEDPTEGMIL